MVDDKNKTANVTAMDVARAAGVSQPTVSRVFTTGSKVSPDLEARVREVASQLGYRPNTLARSLITGRSRTIGLVVAYFDNPFYAEALERLSLALRECGYHIMIILASNDEAENDRVIEELMDHQVDGMILASLSMSSPLSARLVADGTPLVLFNRGQDNPDLSSVTSTNRLGARRATEHLLAAGHKRIAHISGWQGASTGRDRRAGFEAAFEKTDLTPHAILDGMYSRDTAMEATRELFWADTAPDAIFVGNDHMAFGVMDVLRGELGLSIPDDVSIIGYDDVAMSAWPGYDLTTIRQPANRMIEATVTQLLAQITTPDTPPRQITIEGALIERGSSRKIQGFSA